MSTRTAFTTSRLLEFCTVAELTKLVGANPTYWPCVIVKELIDNGLDAAEEAGIAPEISVAIDRTAQDSEHGTIMVADNGPGITPETVTRLLDFRTKTSSREAFISPSRGAQGNALQSLLAMPFALDGANGKTLIESHGVAHEITFTIDPIRREPRIKHVQRPAIVQSGTRITVRWPVSACSELAAMKANIVQVARNFGWLNPHAAITLTWDGAPEITMPATHRGWQKWTPDNPAPAHWYNDESLARLIAACVAHDQDHGRDRTVREFIAEFRGLARSGAQKIVLDALGATRMSLRGFFGDGDRARVHSLLAMMQSDTKPVPAKDIGVLGRAHFEARFKETGVDPSFFQYKAALGESGGMPYVLEASFGYCPGEEAQIKIAGLNWSPSLFNPFRWIGTGSLDTLLTEQRVGWGYTTIFALNLASPRLAFTDKAKSEVALSAAVAADLRSAVTAVTKNWARIIKAEERDASLEARRTERLARSRRESVKDVAYEVMKNAYQMASEGDDGKRLPANARQIMYAARPEIQRRTGKQLDDAYFTQTLLPDYMAENPDETKDWDVVFDDRGHFIEPHTGLTIGLGTLNVRAYLKSHHDIEFSGAALVPACIITRGPQGCFSAVLFTEKEGFFPLFRAVQLAERFDIAIMSTKGVSVTAARRLADEMCGKHNIPLLPLHDFDKAGFSIWGGLTQSNRRYTYRNEFRRIDLGLRLDDTAGLQREAVFDKGDVASRRANLRKNGATEAEIEILLKERTELNAMTSRQLVAFLERKLEAAGIKKVVPSKADLADAYRLFARGREAEKIVRRELKKLNGAAALPVPKDLGARVKAYLQQHPTARWDEAVAAIVKS